MANYPTNGDDVITVDRPDRTVDGLGGDDHIRGFANLLRLLGNTGDDWLVSDLWFYSETAGVFVGQTYLDGGAGADQLDVFMHFDNANTTDALETSADLSADLRGGDGDDQLTLEMAGEMSDMSARLSGGDGNDLIVASLTNVELGDIGNSLHEIIASGGLGDDVIRLSSNTGPANFNNFAAAFSATGGGGADTLVATTFASISGSPVSNVTLDGGSGSDILRATAELRTEYAPIADIHLIGGTGDDRLDARALAYGDRPDAENLLEGGGGADVLKATMALLTPEYFSQSGRAENLLYGGAGDDTLTGAVENSLATGTWHSVLDGGDGADTLRVSGGRDNVLRGGAGLDQMWAGGGTDRFVFLAASDSTQAARDAIHDFGAGDRIGVAALDAGRASGNQAFDFTGTTGGAGDRWVVERGDDAVVVAQTEAGARLVIRVADAADHAWTAEDFLL